MSRAPFQVLVLPYRRAAESFEFGVLRRADDGRWQGIAGGGEDGETPLEAARREAREEACIPAAARYVALDATCSLPASMFRGSAAWGEDVYVIPEHSFGVDCTGLRLSLSAEHAEFLWLPYAGARERLSYDSNRTALWELNQKIRGLGPRDAPGR